MWEPDDLTSNHAARPPDAKQAQAREALRRFIEERGQQVFFSRQLEVALEDEFFHWVTNRAIRNLEGEGVLRSVERELPSGGRIKLLWDRRYRYYRRAASAVVDLVSKYADPNIGGAIGLHGEAMVLEGFAREQFVMLGREVREHEGAEWTRSDHDLDFVFSRDGQTYGVEVKNTLGYPELEEIRLKIEMCKEIGVRPVLVARMLPKSWMHEINRAGGFGLLLKYQLYPWTHRALASEVAARFELPVDAPRRIEAGTMARFVRWHERNV